MITWCETLVFDPFVAEPLSPFAAMKLQKHY